MTEDQVVDTLFALEGTTYGDKTTKPPIDQPTGAGGITLDTLADYVAATGAQLIVSVETLKKLTRSTADPIVRWKWRKLQSDYHFDRIAFDPLKQQLTDFAYNSGPALAIRWFQRVLRVPRTGKMDEATFAALEHSDAWLVNQALVAARLQMVDLWTDSNAQAKMWEEGVESRGLKYSLLEVP